MTNPIEEKREDQLLSSEDGKNECTSCKKIRKIKSKNKCGYCLTKEWRKKNPDCHKAQAKRIREKKKDQLYLKARIWAKNNPEKVYKKHLNYRKNNPLKFKEKGRIWRKNNPEKSKNISSNRYYRVKRATPPWQPHDRFWKVSPKKENYCQDHIIPIQHQEVCGLNVPWNIQYLSKRESSIKGNSFDLTHSNEGWRKRIAMQPE